MSTNWVRTGVVSLIACLAMGACDDNPVNDGRGDAVSLGVNPEFAVVNAADTTRVYVVALDRYGELTYGGVQYTACDNKITVAPDTSGVEGRVPIEAPERTLVLGNTLGESCVTATGPGGLSATATIQVLPAKVEATLPAVLGSGASVAADIELLDKAGDPVSGFTAADLIFSVSDASVADVDANGNVTGKAPGAATLNVSLASKWMAPRTASADFSVEPGVFDGTIAPASANWGTTITFSAGAEAFDADSHVEFDGLTPYVLSQDESDIVVVGPAGMGGSPSDVLILDVGPNQLAYAATIEVPDPDPMDANEPNNDISEATPRTLPVDEWVSVNEGLDVSDYFVLELTAETTFDIEVGWNIPDASLEDDPDVDVYIYDSTGTDTELYDCASSANPEVCTVTLGVGTWYIEIYVWDAHGHDWLTTWFKMSQ